MEIDKNKLAQMREESQDTLNVLEDVLSANPTEESNIEIEENETPQTVKTSLRGMSLSPIKEKIGKFHIAFLKEIHELGKQSNVSNDSMASIVKKYQVNLFDALSCIDQVAQDKYQFSILKESMYEPSSQQIRIEFDSDNVEKFLSLESADNWKTDLGCNRPDNSEFQQQIHTYLKGKGQKSTIHNKNNHVAQKPNRDPGKVEIVQHPDIEEEFGFSITCGVSSYTKDSLTVVAKTTAKHFLDGHCEIHFICYDQYGKISGRQTYYLSPIGKINSAIIRWKLYPEEEVSKVEVFPAQG